MKDKILFGFAIAVGLTLAGVTYLGMFNRLSETQLVQLSIVWFLPLSFGVSGFIARLLWLRDPPPEPTVPGAPPAPPSKGKNALAMFAQILFRVIPPFISLGILLVVGLIVLPMILIKKRYPPLPLAFLGTVLWVPFLVVFLVFVFPSL